MEDRSGPHRHFGAVWGPLPSHTFNTVTHYEFVTLVLPVEGCVHARVRACVQMTSEVGLSCVVGVNTII